MTLFLQVLELLTPVLSAALNTLASGAGERAALDAAAEALADLRARKKFPDFLPK